MPIIWMIYENIIGIVKLKNQISRVVIEKFKAISSFRGRIIVIDGIV
jgi:hypothetical protein